jgi:hypothetical protein
MKAWQQTLLLGAGFGVAFLLGQRLPLTGQAEPNLLSAQGRGPVNPPPPSSDPTPPVNESAPPVVYSEESGQASSTGANGGFVAVTGSYGVGTSVLYLIDTVNRQLAVYEARGGSAEQRRIVLVGARRIDLDLQLPNYNDRSEYDYDQLQELFRKRGRKDHDVGTGLEPKNGSRK